MASQCMWNQRRVCDMSMQPRIVFEWYEWKGGVFRPLVEPFQVEVELRDGSRSVARSNTWDWHHDGGPSDIVRWRRAEPLTEEEITAMKVDAENLRARREQEERLV